MLSCICALVCNCHISSWVCGFVCILVELLRSSQWLLQTWDAWIYLHLSLTIHLRLHSPYHFYILSQNQRPIIYSPIFATFRLGCLLQEILKNVMIRLDLKFVANQGLSPFGNSMNNGQHFHFVYMSVPFLALEFLALKCDGLIILL